MIGFALIILVLSKGNLVRNSFYDRKGMIGIGVGSVFGPFLGVSFSLVAIKYAATGVAATLMSLMPVLLIPPAILFFKQKVTWAEAIGAMISIAGVALFFI